MCPTLVTRDEGGVLAVGATGGRRIVSAVTNVLARYIGHRETLEKATQFPRLHTEGDLLVTTDTNFPNPQTLESFGYKIAHSAIGSFNGIERSLAGDVSSAKR